MSATEEKTEVFVQSQSLFGVLFFGVVPCMNPNKGLCLMYRLFLYVRQLCMVDFACGFPFTVFCLFFPRLSFVMYLKQNMHAALLVLLRQAKVLVLHLHWLEI